MARGLTARPSSRSRTICARLASGAGQAPLPPDPARSAMDSWPGRESRPTLQKPQPAHRQMLEAALADLDRALRREGPA